jgi:hypothetical protein
MVSSNCRLVSTRAGISIVAVGLAAISGLTCTSPESPVCGKWQLDNEPWVAATFKFVEGEIVFACDGTFSSRGRYVDLEYKSTEVISRGTYALHEGYLLVTLELEGSDQIGRMEVDLEAGRLVAKSIPSGEDAIYVRVHE